MLALLWTFTAGAQPLDPPRAAEVDGTYDPRRSLAPLVAAVQPAVVTIEVLGDPSRMPEALRDLFGDMGPQGEGSGFIVDATGILLTNHHVVAESRALRVVLHDGTSVGANVLGTDEDLDIAVLQLLGDREWPAVQLADSSRVRVGDWVVAMGNGLGLGTTATTGIVSGMGRRLNHDRFGQDDYIQTDAAINRGNSGGPLFDLDGRVIGMNTAIIAGANTVGFAISSNLIELVLGDLRDRGHVPRGYLGVLFADIPEEMRESLDIKSELGVLVTEVVDGTPAADSGVQGGDVIVEIDGSPIEDRADLLRAIGGKRPGDTVELVVERKRRQKRLKATLAERPRPNVLAEAGDDERDGVPPGVHGVPRPTPGPGARPGREALPATRLGLLGVEMIDLPRELAKAIGVRKGVLVARVERGSPAEGRLFPGDVVVEVDRRAVDSVDKVERLLTRAEGVAFLQVVRDDTQHFVELPLD